MSWAGTSARVVVVVVPFGSCADAGAVCRARASTTTAKSRAAMTTGRYRHRSVAIVWILIATLVVSAVIALLLVRRHRQRAERRLTEVPGALQRTTAATSLGLESQGGSPARGTGTLVLTDAEVAFAQWQPDILIRIPRAAIQDVDTTRSHLGKSMSSDLLRIRWAADGGDDAAAFFVRDLDPWLSDLGGRRTEP